MSEASKWHVKGYAGWNDYDGPEDDNIDYFLSLDKSVSEKEVYALLNERYKDKRVTAFHVQKIVRADLDPAVGPVERDNAKIEVQNIQYLIRNVDRLAGYYTSGYSTDEIRKAAGLDCDLSLLLRRMHRELADMEMRLQYMLSKDNAKEQEEVMSENKETKEVMELTGKVVLDDESYAKVCRAAREEVVERIQERGCAADEIEKFLEDCDCREYVRMIRKTIDTIMNKTNENGVPTFGDKDWKILQAIYAVLVIQ